MVNQFKNVSNYKLNRSRKTTAGFRVPAYTKNRMQGKCGLRSNVSNPGGAEASDIVAQQSGKTEQRLEASGSRGKSGANSP